LSFGAIREANKSILEGVQPLVFTIPWVGQVWNDYSSFFKYNDRAEWKKWGQCLAVWFATKETN
jgi:hypothetical protein